MSVTTRYWIVLSWLAFLVGLLWAAGDRLILGSVFVALAGYFRLAVGNPNPRLGELLDTIPGWKWISVTYYLVLASFSLTYMYEIYEAEINPLLATAVFGLPVLVPWVWFDIKLYRELKSNTSLNTGAQ